jgi:hypothetical protein
VQCPGFDLQQHKRQKEKNEEIKGDLSKQEAFPYSWIKLNNGKISTLSKAISTDTIQSLLKS